MRGNIATKAGAADKLPKVSVIIAGRNEEEFIEACLKSVSESDYPQESFEVIFVDDHSTDRTFDVALKVAENSQVKFSVLAAPDDPIEMGSKKRALNHAIQASTGELLLFTDADDEVKPKWIRSMAENFDSYTGAVIGAAIPSRKKKLGEMLYRLERLMVALTSASQVGWGFPGTACGQNLAIRKDVFAKIGGYAYSNIPSGDDDLMVQAIARAGWRVRFANSPDAVVSDRRLPNIRAHRDATTRHQSVTKYYPLRWRLLYLTTILSGILLFSWLVFSIITGNVSLYFWYALGVKLLFDSIALLMFTHKLRLSLSFSEFFAAHILLPIYSIVRPLFALRSVYQWRNRTVRNSSGTLSQYPMT